MIEDELFEEVYGIKNERLTNLLQLKYILGYIQRKNVRVKEAYDNSKSYKRIALAKKLKKARLNKDKVLERYELLKDKYGYK